MEARSLGRMDVLDADGNAVALGSLWRDRPAVIVWMRHFGCLYCMEQAREFRKARPSIEAAGARLVLIGNGGVKHLAAFKAAEAPDITVLTDPALRTYNAIGARSGIWRTVGPRSWKAGLRALGSGARQSRVKGHPFQQGGVLVVLPGDRIAFTYLSISAGDHPSVESVLDSLRPSAASTAAS